MRLLHYVFYVYFEAKTLRALLERQSLCFTIFKTSYFMQNSIRKAHH